MSRWVVHPGRVQTPGSSHSPTEDPHLNFLIYLQCCLRVSKHQFELGENMGWKPISDMKAQITDLIAQFRTDFEKLGVECKYRFVNITVCKHKVTCLVLWFEFANGLKKDNAKEFSLVVAKKSHDKITINQKILSQVKCTLSDNLNFIQKSSGSSIRKNNLLDFLKYLFCYKYSYKKEIFGIDVNIFRLVIVVIVLLLCAVLSFWHNYQFYTEYGYWPLIRR